MDSSLENASGGFKHGYDTKITVIHRANLVFILYKYDRHDEVEAMLDQLEVDVVTTLGRNSNIHGAIDSLKGEYGRSDYENNLPGEALELITRLRSDRVEGIIDLTRQQALLMLAIRSRDPVNDYAEVKALEDEHDFLILEHQVSAATPSWFNISMRYHRLVYEWNLNRTPECILRLEELIKEGELIKDFPESILSGYRATCKRMVEEK